MECLLALPWLLMTGAIAIASIIVGGLSALILHILADVICDLAVSKNCLIHIYQKLEKQD